MELLLIRHARPAPQHSPGGADPALTEEGRQQAELLGRYLVSDAVARPTVVHSSPMRRAVETAEALGRHLRTGVLIDDRLREFDHGSATYTPPELNTAPAARRAMWQALETGVWGDHTFDPIAFEERVAAVFAEIVDRHPAEVVAVVCHSGVINSYLGGVLDRPRGMFFAPRYTSVSRVIASARRRRLDSMNESPHLQLPAAAEQHPTPAATVDPATRSPSSAVFGLDHPHAVAPRELVGLLGGKGAGLAEMTSVLGLPVPPGFTLAVPLCAAYRRGGWPDGLDTVLTAHLTELEERTGRRLGDPADPLLVAVRSGAPRSMPGMLDTVLDIGLNEATVEGLAATSGAAFAWDSYRRFLTMYATTVLGVPAERLGGGPAPAEPTALRDRVAEIRRILAEVGAAIPEDPALQLRGAIEAVFRSWDSPRARVYRQREGIDEDLGTAVTVQAMVFGNLDEQSGTGVVFTRDPATGENRPYGDFLLRAQGEDVVAGTARTLTLDDMAERLPQAHRELTDRLAVLERHYRDLCDVEFTVERGRLYILQTRVGKRGAVAAVRLAADMRRDPAIALSAEEARARVDDETLARARKEIVAAARQAAAPDPDATGVGASPGRVSGVVVLDADAAADAEGDVILVRPETSPEDVHGMAVAVGIVTSTGGLVSHAAVVARGWGIPAVVGASGLTVGPADVRDASGAVLFAAGDVITIDGATGAVWRGAVAAGGSAELSDDEIVRRDLPDLLTIFS